MKKISKILVNCSLLAMTPFAVQAAGTYYTGGYQSPQQQQRYNNAGYSQQQGYYNQTNQSSNYSRSGYTPVNSNQTGYAGYQQPQQRQVQQQPKNAQANQSSQKGFYLDGGISRETAMYQFDMNESGSLLHYDNVSWNVFDVNGGYKFDMGNTAAQIDFGVKIGMQSGESTMVDDDITNGGYLITQWINGVDGSVIGEQIGHALSVGTSDGGKMFGFNVGFGLTDMFTIGNMKVTPSVGYRHFNYKLETKKNYGLSLDTAACFEINGEVQYDPAIIIHYADGTQQILWRDNIYDGMLIGNGAESVDPGGTYYYQQPGVSHSYDVTWSGPYLAMDMRYDINKDNFVDARIELGLPGYTAEGDQPYRFDWQHPKSVEDKAGIGSALHLGLGANWNTALSDTVMLSIGLTYNYYSVSGADAKTYLSEGYYMGIYNSLLTEWIGAGYTEADMLDPTTGDPTALNIKDLQSACPGWVCSANNEVNSFYKSMGVRVGLSARF